MSKRLPRVWPAEPHTIAKIAILKGYLKAWFRILGSTRRKEVILFVDGFAGPGGYTNHEEGSPLAALRCAEDALQELGAKFIAERIHGAFIETNRQRFDLLCEAITHFEGNPKLGVTKKCCEFADGMRQIRAEVPAPFAGEGPLLVFADPFGGTDIPFSIFAECMEAKTAELLINLDADGIARIHAAVTNNNRETQLTELFGSDCWREALTAGIDSRKLGLQILDLYKARLRTLPDVKFVWSFAMRGKTDALNYHLVFATKHSLGMEKMKEAMRAIDKTGSYSFSDAHAEQWELFRDGDAERYADNLFQTYNEKTISYEEAEAFALNETPFTNPKSMLAVLEKQERLQVETYENEPRRAGSFPKEKVRSLRFGHFGATTAQGEFLL